MKYIINKYLHGIISINDFSQSFRISKKGEDWLLPLSVFDKLQLALVNFFSKYFWFSSKVLIDSGSDFPPQYTAVISFLKKANYIDKIGKKEIRFPGYYGFFIEKNISIGNAIYPVTAYGFDKNQNIALSKALGEIVERIGSGLKDEENNTIEKSFSEIFQIYNVMYPPRVHRFLDVQKKDMPELGHTDDRKILWVKGENLFTKEKVFVPRDVTSWFLGPRTSRTLFLHSTTNGCAGHFSKDVAVLSALFEVIERDAFLVHWLTKISPRKLAVESLPESLKKRVELFKEWGYVISILITTTDIKMPCVNIICSTKNSGDFHKITLSGACRLTYREAIEKGLDELISCAPWITEETAKENPQTYKEEPFLSRIDKLGRFKLWSWNSIDKNAKHLIAGESISWRDLILEERDFLKNIEIENLNDNNKRLDIALVLLKSIDPSLNPIVYFPKNKTAENLGFILAQVYIEKLFPLYLIECYGTFESDRLVAFSKWKGRETFELCTYPHMLL